MLLLLHPFHRLAASILYLDPRTVAPVIKIGSVLPMSHRREIMCVVVYKFINKSASPSRPPCYLRLGRRLDLARSKESKYAASSSRAWCEMPPLDRELDSLVVDDSDVLDDDGVRGRDEVVARSKDCCAGDRMKYEV